MDPKGYINFEVYEDGTNLCGIANITPPDIKYLTQSISGAGLAGNIETIMRGMVDTMGLQINFHTVTGAAASLAAPKMHMLDLRVAEEYYDKTAADLDVQADKYIMQVMPKTISPGQIAPASASAASGEFSVYRYEAYKDGEELWVIDPENMICRVGGIDYLENVRKALGKA